jgi:hypothetical protein
MYSIVPSPTKQEKRAITGLVYEVIELSLVFSVCARTAARELFRAIPGGE